MTKLMDSVTTKNFNKVEFWDDKIIEWENKRYIKRIPSIITGSVNHRMTVALNILRQCSKDLIVVEAGCGTARLMPFLLTSGVKKYIGIDFSRCAIDAARKRADNLGAPSNVEFIQEDIANLKTIKADLCFSLGLLDWLTDQEICFFLNKIKTSYYLHSFSERKINVQQVLHRFYVYLQYGYKTKTYVPRYYTREEIGIILKPYTLGKPEYYVDNKMSFSCFAYNLPFKHNAS